MNVNPNDALKYSLEIGIMPAFVLFPDYSTFNSFMKTECPKFFGILNKEEAEKAFLLGEYARYKTRKPPWKGYKWDKRKKVEIIQKGIVLSEYILTDLLGERSFKLIPYCQDRLGVDLAVDESAVTTLRRITFEWIFEYLAISILTINKKSQAGLNYASGLLNYTVMFTLRKMKYSKGNENIKTDGVFTNSVSKYLNVVNEKYGDGIYSAISKEAAKVLDVDDATTKNCIEDYFLNNIFLRMDIEGIAKFNKFKLLFDLLRYKS